MIDITVIDELRQLNCQIRIMNGLLLEISRNISEMVKQLKDLDF